MRILVAEDQALARLILTGHLRNWGHEVVETVDGQEALNHIISARNEIDMLITDWSMPRLNGLELSNLVRNLSSNSRYIYIILLTSHSELSDRLLGFAQGGVDDYIVKPFVEAELQHRINVANRIITAERQLRHHSRSLEDVVRHQTETIRHSQEEIITRLFSALESRDQETGNHVRRIGLISAKLGSYLGWNQGDVDAIQAAAPLHDVGKIGVQDNVLLKRDRLTEEEFQIIRNHTLIGANILANSKNQIISLAEVIALRHHENWDGTGYPDGLQGEAIPVTARVVAVADVYDALMADRIYRKGLPEEEVLKILQHECGRKFDPQIAMIFLKNIDDIRDYYKAMEKDAGFAADQKQQEEPEEMTVTAKQAVIL
ncbi:MAG: response regulator [Candidatus Adiutrix sp.]|jgi:putative two-component system response regulator|nr:response regulator [Candidatus Adiutrix sp.]